MNSYQKFLRLGISLAPLGIRAGSDEPAYFCTPKGASLIGWAGTDGIHYCFVRGFGETVFAVSPMNTAPDYVHPLAENFTDLLRLLLACGGAAALEQAWMWDKAQFESFLQANPATEEQKKTLAEIAEKTHLTAMEQPWAYIRSLQASFDYSSIPYTDDYYDMDMNPAAQPAASKTGGRSPAPARWRSTTPRRARPPAYRSRSTVRCSSPRRPAQSSPGR